MCGAVLFCGSAVRGGLLWGLKGLDQSHVCILLFIKPLHAARRAMAVACRCPPNIDGFLYMTVTPVPNHYGSTQDTSISCFPIRLTKEREQRNVILNIGKYNSLGRARPPLFTLIPRGQTFQQKLSSPSYTPPSRSLKITPQRQQMIGPVREIICVIFCLLFSVSRSVS